MVRNNTEGGREHQLLANYSRMSDKKDEGFILTNIQTLMYHLAGHQSAHYETSWVIDSLHKPRVKKHLSLSAGEHKLCNTVAVSIWPHSYTFQVLIFTDTTWHTVIS